MTDIAAIYNVPSTQTELDTWSFAHMAHHRDINSAIFQATGIIQPEYVLDPVNVANKEAAGVWLDQHQIMHNDFNAVLNYPGFNLQEVDFADRNLLAGWTFLHATEHQNAADVLGIG